jgi:hypothetical protein
MKTNELGATSNNACSHLLTTTVGRTRLKASRMLLDRQSTP